MCGEASSMCFDSLKLITFLLQTAADITVTCLPACKRKVIGTIWLCCWQSTFSVPPTCERGAGEASSICFDSLELMTFLSKQGSKCPVGRSINLFAPKWPLSEWISFRRQADHTVVCLPEKGNAFNQGWSFCWFYAQLLSKQESKCQVGRSINLFAPKWPWSEWISFRRQTDHTVVCLPVKGNTSVQGFSLCLMIL